MSVGAAAEAAAAAPPCIRKVLMKGKRGMEVAPGQKAPEEGQGWQEVGNTPKYPGAHPPQAVTWDSSAPPTVASGELHTRGAHWSREVGSTPPGTTDCSPTPQVTGMLKHWLTWVAPVEAVLVPLGQGVQSLAEALDGAPLGR